MDYNKTVHLPKTDFPMRAGLPKREPELLNPEWARITYHKLMDKNAGKPKFVLHDGPPYANGNIHIGTAMNKILKDIIVKYKNMTGYQAPYVPGWDTHGLPIETAVLKDKGVKREEMSVAAFRDKCRQFATQYVGRMTEQFQRLGVLGEWENPYITLLPEFEAKQIEVFGKMAEKGLIYKGMKSVYWCPHDQTALAEAEIDYQDDPCTTIFVKFPVKDDKGKLAQYCDLSKTFFVIWTTTPWTIPGNTAISLNAAFDYVLLQAPNGEVYVLAKELAEGVCRQAGLDFDACKVLATLKGSDFELMVAKHPLLDQDSVILNGEHVTLDAGTGCVHTAPGFGADDYQTCRRYNMEMVVPVDNRGRHTDYAGKYAGMTTDESNPVILADMKESGALFASEDIVHSYPHCWRCKHPIIFRATPQWFCSVESFKDQAIAAAEEVRWVPKWGIDRMKSMIRERSDWCISRQRRWGLPIPVFYCQDCGKPVCDGDTIAAVSQLFAAQGSNAWYEKEAGDILPAGYQCPHCGGARFTKEEDTLDGWFDSGSTHFASMKKDQGFWPATVYMEGLDQYRGWFQSSLLTAVGALGQGAPFRECVTHGWTVDGEGKAMHKSLGNGVDPADIFKKYGADMIRLWAGSADYHADVRCSDNIFKQLSQSYLKFRNTARYCLGNLDGFDADHLAAPEEMLELDRWAVTRLNRLMERCEAAYQNYEFHVVSHAVNDFCVVELSSFYLDIIKDRLYCEEKDGLTRRSAQTALWLILDTMTKIFAPILAFTCDEIWQAMPHREEDDARNVLFNDMHRPFTDYALDAAAMERWAVIEALRDQVNAALEAARSGKKIGKSLEARVTLRAADPDSLSGGAAARGVSADRTGRVAAAVARCAGGVGRAEPMRAAVAFGKVLRRVGPGWRAGRRPKRSADRKALPEPCRDRPPERYQEGIPPVDHRASFASFDGPHDAIRGVADGH